MADRHLALNNIFSEVFAPTFPPRLGILECNCADDAGLRFNIVRELSSFHERMQLVRHLIWACHSHVDGKILSTNNEVNTCIYMYGVVLVKHSMNDTAGHKIRYADGRHSSLGNPPSPRLAGGAGHTEQNIA